jgi:hypothetical protein
VAYKAEADYAVFRGENWTSTGTPTVLKPSLVPYKNPPPDREPFTQATPADKDNLFPPEFRHDSAEAAIYPFCATVVKGPPATPQINGYEKPQRKEGS